MEQWGDHLPGDLDAVGSRLRAARAELDPVQLDQIKQRVIARSSATARPAVRSKVATVATVLALVGGTGAAIAVADTGNANQSGSASHGQYKPGKGCGHHHPPDTKCPHMMHHSRRFGR